MAANNHHDSLQDAQGNWWEMLSSTQVLTGQAPNVNNKSMKSKCHGNRKLQRFKRKCRLRGLNEEQITVLIQNRNHTILEQTSNHPTTTTTTVKRKRDRSQQDLLNQSLQSWSQLSISQDMSKRIKNSTEETVLVTTNHDTHSSQEEIIFYKQSKYLKMPRKLLLQSLQLQLNCKLKKKKEQCFILKRLQLLDQQFCLNQIHYLYQTYFHLGSQYHMWPVS